MYYFLISLLLVFTLSSEEQTSFLPSPSFDDSFALANIEGEPSAVVAGCVNVITGDFLDMQSDLMVVGGESLAVERSYCSSDHTEGGICKGWHFNLQGAVKCFHSTDCYVLKGAFGSELLFGKLSLNQAHLSKKMLKKGFTNNASGHISGKTNLKNMSIKVSSPVDRFCTVSKGDGSRAIYKREKRGKSHDDKMYKLQIEQKPNGMEKHYHYDDNDRLSFVGIVNNNTVLQSISFDYPSRNSDCLNITAKDGRSVQYFFKDSYLSFVQRPNAPAISYNYEKVDDTTKRRVVEKAIGEQKLEIHYFKTMCDGTTNLKCKDCCYGKVHTLFAPVGIDGIPLQTHRFQYEKNACDVFDANGIRTHYIWNKDLRLSSIQKMDASDKIFVSDQLYWGKDGNESNLISRVYSSSVPLFCKTYSYDVFGNVTKEIFYGHLTGQNPAPLFIDVDGQPIETGCDRHEKRYVYSQDGRNLLLLEVEGTRGKAYRYYDNSDLVAVKYTLSHGQIMQRHCYTYSNSALASEIIDNGISENPEDLSGVTFRKIRILTPRNVFPFGVPDSEEEYYQDCSGKTHLLKAFVNNYSIEGNLTRQDCYDANRKFCYSHFWEYNNLGKVTKETDALGQTTERQYDLYGNLTFEQGPNKSYKKLYTHDYSNRLIRIDEEHSDRILSIHYTYDHLGNKKSLIDCYGNETNYHYDEFGRLIHIISPYVLDENDASVRPLTCMAYDSFGNQCLKIDSKGNATTAIYTARGKPHIITHSDGTVEKFTYLLHGPLESYTDPNGCVTKYYWDYQDRTTGTEFYTPDGKLKYSTNKIYDAFHLLSETDAMGNKSEYTYDHFGRKKTVSSKGITTQFEYDPLGRISKKIIGDIIYNFEYDLLNRKLKETVEDLSGNILKLQSYAYDSEGRVILETHGENTTITHYDSYGTPVEVIDALGNVTRTSKIFDYRNDLGQLVPSTEVIDPLGNSTIIIKDALERDIVCIRKNALGTIIQQYTTSYDLNGNESKKVEKVFNEGASHDVIHMWSYDPMNRLVCQIEAQKKKTSYIYNALGQLQSIIKPSGIAINHTYTLDGLLEHYSGSDGSFHYRYEYDLNNNLIASHDEILKRSTHLIYEQDRLVEEKQATGYTIKYAYDDLGRLISLTLPDTTSINYSYDSFLLKKITCHGYQHTFNKYDLSGKCLLQTFLKKAGTLEQAYDRNGRLFSRVSKHTHEKDLVYDAANNLIARKMGNTSCTYSYDDLYQLKSEDGFVSQAYSFDSTYNRVEKNGITTKYNSLNQIIAPGYIYDEDGRLTRTPTSTYTYDALDRLTEVTKNNTTTTYTYDSFNRRLTKNTTTYLYDGQQEIGALNNGRFTEFRVMLGLKTIAIELDGKPYAPVQDISGNIIALINADGSLAESYHYTSFGEELTPNRLSPWRYAGKRFDSESELIYFGHRYYDPLTARWLSPDPLSYAEGPNLYAYVRNNPFSYLDPDGRFVIAIPLICVTFGIGEIAIGIVSAEALYGIVAGAILGVAVYQANQYYDQQLEIQSLPLPSINSEIHTEETDGTSGNRRHSPDQQALSELAKEARKRGGATNNEADALLQWGKEYDFPNTRDDRGVEPQHWFGGDHIHLGPDHIRIIC